MMRVNEKQKKRTSHRGKGSKEKRVAKKLMCITKAITKTCIMLLFKFNVDLFSFFLFLF